jgi:hypothetical protein
MKRIAVVVLPMVAIIFHLLGAGSSLNAEPVGAMEYQVLVGGIDSTKYVVSNYNADPVWSILIGSGDRNGTALSFNGDPQWPGATLAVQFDSIRDSYSALYKSHTLFVNLPVSFGSSEKAYLFYGADYDNGDTIIPAAPIGKGETGTFYAYNIRPFSPFIYTTFRLDDLSGSTYYVGSGTGESVHATVPLPGAILLLAPGLAALMGLKKKYLG